MSSIKADEMICSSASRCCYHWCILQLCIRGRVKNFLFGGVDYLQVD